MNRRLLPLTLLISLIALVPAAGASAATPPTVTSVSPKGVKVGGLLTLRGTGFKPGRGKTTFAFQNLKRDTIRVRAAQATRTRATIKVPRTFVPFLQRRAGKMAPTLFRVRVLARVRTKYSAIRRSPIISAPDDVGADQVPGLDGGTNAPTPLPSDCDRNGTPNSEQADDDSDFLDDSVERDVGTDSCLVDTDRDGLGDGWEYWSAKDLTVKAVPYPGKRPYQNPLDPADRRFDYDQDGMLSFEEHELWVYTGKTFEPSLAGSEPRSESPLGYSDGTQTSKPGRPGRTPAFQSANYGQPFNSPAYPDSLDLDRDGKYSDDERDGDNDGLTNIDETHYRMNRSLWDGVLAGECDPSVPNYGSKEAREDGIYWGPYVFDDVSFLQPSYVDPDTDGDTLLDAEDDQDHDDVSNVEEIAELQCGADDQGRNVHPYNPCAPNQESRTCRKYVPVG